MLHNPPKAKKKGKRKATKPIEPKESSEEDPVTKEFHEELRVVYKDVDKLSTLLWSHDNGLVRPRRRANRQPNTQYNIYATGSSIKSNGQGTRSAKDPSTPSWQTESDAQIGYGEITKGAMEKLFILLQNIDK